MQSGKTEQSLKNPGVTFVQKPQIFSSYKSSLTKNIVKQIIKIMSPNNWLVYFVNVPIIGLRFIATKNAVYLLARD